MVSRFNFTCETCVGDELHGVANALPVGGQIARCEDGVHDAEERPFGTFEVHLATSGATYVGLRNHQPRQAQDFEAIARRQTGSVLVGKACSFDWQKEIYRHRFRLYGAQVHHHVDNVLPCLAHADYSTATYLKTNGLQHFDIGDALIVSVRRANVRIVPTAGVQIVIYAVEACVAQCMCLMFSQKAYGAADVCPATFHMTDFLGQLIDFAVAKTYSAQADAVTCQFVVVDDVVVTIELLVVDPTIFVDICL